MKLMPIFILILISNKILQAQSKIAPDTQHIVYNSLSSQIPDSLIKESEISSDTIYAVPVDNKVKLSQQLSARIKRNKLVFYKLKGKNITYKLTVNAAGDIINCIPYQNNIADSVQLNNIVADFIKNKSLKPGYIRNGKKTVNIITTIPLTFRIE